MKLEIDLPDDLADRLRPRHIPPEDWDAIAADADEDDDNRIYALVGAALARQPHPVTEGRLATTDRGITVLVGPIWDGMALVKYPNGAILRWEVDSLSDAGPAPDVWPPAPDPLPGTQVGDKLTEHTPPGTKVEHRLLGWRCTLDKRGNGRWQLVDDSFLYDSTAHLWTVVALPESEDR